MSQGHRTMCPVLSSPRGQWGLRVGALLLLLGALLYFARTGYATARAAGQGDFRSFYVATQAVALGLDPYVNHNETGNPDLHDPFARDRVYSRYLYPPFFLVCILPLRRLSYETAKALWLQLSIAIGILTVLGYACAVPRRRRFWFVTLATGWLFAAYPFHIHLRGGQADLLLGLLIMLGMLAYQRDRRFAAGLLFGFATNLKVMPILFALYFLAKRRFVVLVGFAVACAAALAVSVLALGPQIVPSFLAAFYELTLSSARAPDLLIYNQSIAAFVHRWFVDWRYTRALWDCARLAQPLSKGLALLVLGIAGWALKRSTEHRPDSRWLAASVLTLLMILVPALSWEYRGVLLLLPMAALWRLERLPAARTSAVLALLFVALALNQYAPLPTTYPLTRVWQLVLISAKTVLLMGLLGLLTALLLRADDETGGRATTDTPRTVSNTAGS